ncbi:MAG: hypothetical protein COA78_00835 [Blastopirellula sp.]|nr:MAG: hypothetical protein COA78_00835 [Blastopirellula sp.]
MVWKSITPLSFSVLPSRFHRRDAPHGFSDWDEKTRELVDDNTLFYDVFRTSEPGRVIAVGPPLKGTLRRFIKDSILSINGVPASVLEISQSRRASILELKAEVQEAVVVTISHPQVSFNIAVNSSMLSKYAGRKSMFTLSRNNDLKWIKDWARFHVETQGVDAIVLFDNASDQYGSADLSEVLDGVQGLKVFDVVSAPFQYGPPGDDRARINARYLQFGLFEITRLRFMAHSEGVINMDIDELAYTPEGTNVFEIMKNSDLGFLTLPGSWRYPSDGTPVCHASHNMHSSVEGLQMQPKWCINPSGQLAGKSWRTHGIQGLSHQNQDGCGFFHCRMISENWHYNRSEYSKLTLEKDPFAQHLFDSVF